MPEIPKTIEERRLEDLENILKSTVRATYETDYGIVEFKRHHGSVPEMYTIELRVASGDTKIKFFIGTSDGGVYSTVVYNKEEGFIVKGKALNKLVPEDLIEDCF